MEPVVQIAAIVALGSILGPVITNHLAARQRRLERAEDFARQDRVAAKVDQAASAVAQVARTAEVTTAETRSQLKQIHTLVNSDMTAARQSELDQTRLHLIVLRRIIAQDEAAGRPSSVEDIAAIEKTEARINELQAILADRLVQMKAVEVEAAAQAKRQT